MIKVIQSYSDIDCYVFNLFWCPGVLSKTKCVCAELLFSVAVIR